MHYAIITPSYGPDFERCRLLCESVGRHVTGDFHHYLIVDARDRSAFRALENRWTTVLTVEELMPWWVRRLPMARGWWFNFKGLPIRNWILQQQVKLSVGEAIDADAYVFADSDIAFFRPFPMDRLSPGGRLRLFRVPGAARLPGHARWHQTAARLLGLPPTDYFGATYIGNLITWRRDELRQLYRRIEVVTGRPWLEALSREWHLSEYILYGVFVEHDLGAGSRHVFEDVPLCHISWDYRIESQADLVGFLGDVRPWHHAVMVSSKLGIPAARYGHLLDQLAAAKAVPPWVPAAHVPSFHSQPTGLRI